MSTFRDRLGRALDDSPLGVRAIAKRVGASSPTRLSEWRRGDGSPTPDQLVKLADVLEVSLLWLVADQGTQEPVEPDEAVERLRVVRMAASGSIDLATLRRLLDEALPGEDAAEAERLLEGTQPNGQEHGQKSRA